MARRALTATQVTALYRDGVHWIAPSLHLQIRQGQGTRSYLFRWRQAGVGDDQRPATVDLGMCPDLVVAAGGDFLDQEGRRAEVSE